MKALADPSNVLATGLMAIRTQFQVPASFPPEVLAAAEAASSRAPTAHVDRTAMPFVTLDPATSTDLDQAFAIEPSSDDLLLHYAIADVAWFVDDGDAVDAEDARGAARVDPPAQEVEAIGAGRYELAFRPLLVSEQRNAALSLAANLAIADTLQAHHTGLFRVMAAPDAHAVERLRHTANAFGLNWPGAQPLGDFERTLDARDPRQAAFMLAIRRAGGGAGYVPYRDGVVPWHAAMAATYAHATAPLRRLADRYVVRATLAVANGQPVPAVVSEAFGRLPAVMAKADARGNQIDRAVIDLAEAAMLKGREGETFAAVVTDLDDRGARIQLRDLPIVARVDASNVTPGDVMGVQLTGDDLDHRSITFRRVS